MYALFILLIAKAVHYPVIYRAYAQTRSPHRRAQMLMLFICSAVSDAIMLGTIMYQTDRIA